MSEIPEDVELAAREAFINFANFSKSEAADTAIEHVRRGNMDEMPMLQLAAHAILAERQRCADLADKEADGYKENGFPQAALGCITTRKAILSQ
jgi:hypothetical protein